MKKNEIEDQISEIWKSTGTKIVVGLVAAVGLTYFASLAMNLIASTATSYKNMRSALKS